MKELSKALGKFYEDIKTKEKLAIHLKNLDKLIKEKRAEIPHWEEVVQDEEKDIQDLEKFNLYNLFKFVLEDKEKQMEKERQEYLHAFLTLKSIKENLLELENERDLFKKNLSSKFNVEKNFDKLVQKEKDKIIHAFPEIGEEIIIFEEKIANHKIKIVEIKQAQKEGQRLIQLFSRSIASMEKIESWGFVKSRNNQVNIDRAVKKLKTSLGITNKHLQKFEEELYDFTDHYTLDYTHQIDDVKHFMRQYYDTLITDWVIESKIEHSLHLVSSLIGKIRRILAMLDQELLETRSYIKTEEKDKRNFIANAVKSKS